MTENSTNTVPKIYDALNKAQHNMTKAKKDANNPHFKSSYATLAAVHDAVMPALLGEGFAVMQAITLTVTGWKRACSWEAKASAQSFRLSERLKQLNNWDQR